jgi:hypothetical protein
MITIFSGMVVGSNIIGMVHLPRGIGGLPDRIEVAFCAFSGWTLVQTMFCWFKAVACMDQYAIGFVLRRGRLGGPAFLDHFDDGKAAH